MLAESHIIQPGSLLLLTVSPDILHQKKEKLTPLFFPFKKITSIRIDYFYFLLLFTQKTEISSNTSAPAAIQKNAIFMPCINA